MDNPLTDGFGRRVEYLRLSLTDRCNYRCFYCLPNQGNHFIASDDLLRHEETLRLVRLFTELGVSKVRLTGGEPLLRKGVIGLAQSLGDLPGLADLSLSTNGHLLGQMVGGLFAAGIRRVNVSLDTLDAQRFERITRSGSLAQVVRGIEKAVATGMAPVKINMVVMRGVNEDEIETMLDFCQSVGAHLRFIETMPVGAAGSRAMARYYPADMMLKRVRDYCGEALIPVKGGLGAGPARHYKLGHRHQTVGVISALSRHFCDGCNRVRLSAQGRLVLCLGQEASVDLQQLLRCGAADDRLKEAIQASIMEKPRGHDFNRQEVAIPRSMSSLGG